MKIAKSIISAAIFATVAITAVGCSSTNKQASTGEYVDDAVITTKVKAALINDPNVKAREVNVETFKGDVQLSGFVADPRDAQRAVEITRGVKGVTSVKNDIRVK
ncbi:BON domain-containing protein [Massilia aurea]|uniref:BON domain-containing protein n=1 Tax=Massilia aurea TaxID=373040 RepID=UPI0034629C48